MRIAGVALGKIGLPLAVQFADAGHDVVGVDVNERTVIAVNEGREPFPGEAHLAEKLAMLVPAGRLRATTHYSEAIPGADAVPRWRTGTSCSSNSPATSWMTGPSRVRTWSGS